MAQTDDMSSLFPVFLLSILALFTVPWTITAIFQGAVGPKVKSRRCPCSQCTRATKNRDSLATTIGGFLSCTNVSLIALWFTMLLLLRFILISAKEMSVFEPYTILGLQPGATDSQIKKAYHRLSLEYHPDKNPDPEATNYFVNFISKAHQALTDEVSRKNMEEFGHPDGRQGINVGIALPKFMLDMQGSQAGYLLLALVGIGILLPLLIVVVYLHRSAKYTGNNVMHQTLVNYYHFIKQSLPSHKIMDVLVRAAEFLEIPVRRSEEPHLQALFPLVRSELNLDPKALKQETLKFWRRHPTLVKVELLLFAQLTRQGKAVPQPLQADFQKVMELLPRLLEELMKMSVMPRTASQHGWLRPAQGVMELSQSIMQAVPLSARKTSERAVAAGWTEGIGAFLQLPHVDDNVIKKLARKKVRTLQELRDMETDARVELLTSVGGLSATETRDVEAVLSMMPTISLDIICETEGEEGIQEGDVVTLKAWVKLQRPCGLVAAFAHSPHFPVQVEEHYWILLGDVQLNSVWVSQRVSFAGDESAAVAAAGRVVREGLEGRGVAEDEVNRQVKEAMARVKGGERLVMARFQAPEEGVYALSAFCLSDVWIGCDKKTSYKLRVSKKVAGRGLPTASDSAAQSREEDDDDDDATEGDGDEEIDDEDVESEYSEEEEDDEEDLEAETKQANGVAEKGAGTSEEAHANGDVPASESKGKSKGGK
eukprot:TRINITY_DN38414_c0_g1_i1.p1 TRINITY_DN38414_c0_g1~~TRINITY_DN38414_c0_g1_i1.p1  ORF type:complete len:712 (+),score=130.13 TRINITY_DN38414_c0_g1_i1:204-2339(+)